jgi:hypothetical protein
MSNGRRNRGVYKPQVEALTQRLQILEQTIQNLVTAPPSRIERAPDASTDILKPLTPSYQIPLLLNSQLHFPGQGLWPNAPDCLDSLPSDYLDEPEPGIPVSLAIDPADPDPVSPSTTPPSILSHYSEPVSQSTIPQPPFLDSLQLHPSAVDYLLGLYFHRYQIMLHFVSQQQFMAQRAMGTGPMLRESLFLAMLAIGSRYSTRPEINEKYIRADGENLFASAAKKALEKELRNSDIVTVKAILILAEVETGAGNDMTGYMYWNMAARLIFELRLDLVSSVNEQTLSLADDEFNCRYWIIWAASVGDQYWGVELRKSLQIKFYTLQLSRHAAKLAKGGIMHSRLPQYVSFEEEVNEYLLDLLEITREITDTIYGLDTSKCPMKLMAIASEFNKRLDQWFAMLPQRIQQGPISGEVSYHFIFILHLIYNSNKIVLYRDLAKLILSTSDNGVIIEYARGILALSSIKIARIFELFRNSEDVRTMQSTGTQWAGLATYALIDHIRCLPVDEVVEAVAHLQSLGRTLKEMSRTFKTALQPYQDACQNVEQIYRRLEGAEVSSVENLQQPTEQYHLAGASRNVTSSQISNTAQSIELPLQKYGIIMPLGKRDRHRGYSESFSESGSTRVGTCSNSVPAV